MNVTERVMMPRCLGVGNEATCSAIINEYTAHIIYILDGFIGLILFILLYSLVVPLFCYTQVVLAFKVSKHNHKHYFANPTNCNSRKLIIMISSLQ